MKVKGTREGGSSSIFPGITENLRPGRGLNNRNSIGNGRSESVGSKKIPDSSFLELLLCIAFQVRDEKNDTPRLIKGQGQE